MKTNSILILGGYGNTGRLIARLLLRQTDRPLILAGRNLDKAQTAAQALNAEFGAKRVSAIVADAADVDSLRRAMAACQLVVVASSTSEFVDQVARAALDTQTDYLDVQYSTAKVKALQALAPEITAAGRCFITDGGFHPGLPAALVRCAATKFDRLERAIVSSVIKVDWASLDIGAATAEELVRELLGFQILEYRDGGWRPAGWRSMWMPQTIDFGRDFGRQACAPMFLEEMRALPQIYPGLQEVGFLVGGFNWFVDWLVMPAAIVALRLWPQGAVRPMARLMYWGLGRFSKPPFGTMLKLEAEGIVRGEPKRLDLTMYHADGYWLTAIPVVACLLQYLDASVSARQPGLWFQAHIVEPDRLLTDMERMGVEISGSLRSV